MGGSSAYKCSSFTKLEFGRDPEGLFGPKPAGPGWVPAIKPSSLLLKSGFKPIMEDNDI